MRIEASSLGALADCYGQVLELTPRACELLADPAGADDLQKEYAAAGFLKIANILPAEALTRLVTTVLPVLSVIAEEVTLRQEPGADHKLSDGARFRRVDPYCVRHPASREKMSTLLRELGLTELGALLAERLTPLVHHVAGRVSFERTYFYVYEEGDYISVHDDRHVGGRVDVQFPVTLGTVAGVRVLSEGLLRMHYDATGSMNVLGPNVWHDVPPILRLTPEVAPRRFNMGFRFMPG